MKAETFTFYRPKVSIEQTHELTRDTRRGAVAMPMGNIKSGQIANEGTARINPV
jgi:hypothetical protein